jgi:cytoskeletal protein CcmA (bactofilin family)
MDAAVPQVGRTDQKRRPFPRIPFDIAPAFHADSASLFHGGSFMFTRNPANEPAPIEPRKPAGPPSGVGGVSSPAASRPSPLRSGSSEGGKSIISNDLKIIGQGLKIISRGTLQVDGEVEGDVAGAEVIIGEQGRVTGTVAAERVIVRGRTSGVIRAMTVALQASARVEGDIHHMSLAIEQGAEFDGRCRRPASPAELQVDLDGNG